MSTLDDFERQVMTALLAGDDPLLEMLREQYALATSRREETPHGFVTRFEVPPAAPAMDGELLHLDDLQVELEGASAPVDAALTVDDGRLQTLECSIYEGTFPQAPAIKAAWYYGTKKYPGITPELMAERDVEDLLEQ